MTQTHFRTCNLCEAMCGVRITVDGGHITDVRGDDDDPFSRGHICPKAVALKDIHEDPDRLRRPMKRTAAGWEEISWERAFDEIAAKIIAVQKQHGRDSVAVYQGNPTVHNHGSIIHGQLFMHALRTRNRYSATSLDQLPHMLAGLLMFGHQLMLPVPDVDRTDYFLMLGANPVVSNGSLMTAPGIAKRLKAIRARGGKLVVIDPRRTETAELADRHLFIRPGTDALLLAALVGLVFELKNGAPDLGRCAGFTKGLDAVARAVRPFTPEKVAAVTGVDAAEIRKIAEELLAAKTAVVYGRVGLSTQEHGSVANWLINVLNIVTGNFDRAGGAMFANPAIDMVDAAAKLGQKGHFARRKSRVRGLPEFGGEYPAAVLAEEIDTPGEGRIRALVTSAGNPVLSAPNGRRLERALESLDLMVSIDIYLNETTKHAHYILPPTFALEHGHYDLVFHLLAVHNTAKYSEPLFERPKDARHDWEIFLELGSRLQAKNPFAKLVRPAATKLLSKFGPDWVLDYALRKGPYKLTLKKLKENPHGIDLGPLEPCLPRRLYTSDEKLDLAPEEYLKDLARAESKLSRGAEDLVLIGRRELRSNNSWMHNSQRLVKGADRCTLFMNPADAAARGLAEKNGQPVEVATRAGSATAKLEITDEVMPGVVSLPHGWGHHRSGTKLRVANAHAGISINDLTDEMFVDEMTGNVSFSGVPVRVR